jgi:hypothetical protein
LSAVYPLLLLPSWQFYHLHSYTWLIPCSLFSYLMQLMKVYGYDEGQYTVLYEFMRWLKPCAVSVIGEAISLKLFSGLGLGIKVHCW